MGMFTSGWVWFVTDKHGNTGVIPTFGPGTPLVRSRNYIANAKDLFLGEDLAQLFRGDPLLPYIYANEDFKDEHGKPLSMPPREPVSEPSPPAINSSSFSSGVSGAKSPRGQDPLLPRFYHSSAASSSNVGTVLAASVWGEEDPSVHDRSVPHTKVAMLNIGEYLTPLFCVSVNEHAWMTAGYGVWGKEEWLKKFWTVLDWQKVSSMYAYAVPDKSFF
jgi:Fe-Mn family superoxide dismutase